MICPDCGVELVKGYVECDDGSGYIGCWICDCEYEGDEDSGEGD